MASRPITREDCARRFDRLKKQPDLDVNLDTLCMALSRPGNASEMSRWLRGARITAPGRVGPVEVWAALDRLEQRVAA